MTQQGEDEMPSLVGFQVERVLSEDAVNKTVAVLGKFAGKPGDAIALLSRRHFDVEGLGEILSDQTQLTQVFQNDIYSKVRASSCMGCMVHGGQTTPCRHLSCLCSALHAE